MRHYAWKHINMSVRDDSCIGYKMDKVGHEFSGYKKKRTVWLLKKMKKRNYVPFPRNPAVNSERCKIQILEQI